MIGIPIIVSVVYKVMPTWSEFVVAASALLAIYVIKSLTEVLAYSPLVGSACYITFITGNVNSLKIPAALNAQELSNSPMGTERGDAVSCMAVGVSSLVTMVVVALGVVLLVPLQPLLQNPTVTKCTGQMLPALFGCMMIQHITSTRSGDYIIKGKIWTFIVPFFMVLAVHYFIMPINGKEAILLLIMIPVSILIAAALYKLNIVKAIEVQKNKN